MAATEQVLQPQEQPLDKGLKSGALGLISNIVIATASVAPAYSLAATLGFVVAAIGLQSPAVAVLAFVPMLLCSIGYNELNKADPDAGTTFTWSTRAFSPGTGWAGGWAIVASDILVMASLAQVAGQYIFFLFGGPSSSIGQNPTSGWVLLLGILWIGAMAIICYVGIEVSANFQKVLLGIELVMLTVLAVTALVRAGIGHHPAVSIPISASWFNPFHAHFTSVISGLVTTSVQSFAGIGGSGIGLGNPANTSDVLSVLGGAIFGSSGIGAVLSRLLFLMVLSSAAASTQTTILPTARTTLAMATYKALPSVFAKVHPRFLTPTWSTIVMGLVSIAVYVPMNYIAGGLTIADAVTAIGLYIAFYYGLTGFACAWYYRRTLLRSTRNLFMQGVLPVLGGLIMYFAGGWSLWADWDVGTGNSYTSWTIPFFPGWHIGGAFVIFFLSAIAGVIVWIYLRIAQPAFFRRQTLTRSTPTLVPDD